ncbi:MAG: hypothetical protein JNM34_03855 [Chthonomonadaceae bacterium]|nr:hypothetical protein [Chthonomonadaceae bacterium]
MAKVHTLTVPDLVWINLQVSGSTQPFDYARLEEGTFYQFGHKGDSSLATRAARFLTGFPKLAPFNSFNEQTAIFATLAFLEGNGLVVSDDPVQAMDWLRSLGTEFEDVRTGLQAKVDAGLRPSHGLPDFQNLVTQYDVTKYGATKE